MSDFAGKVARVGAAEVKAACPSLRQIDGRRSDNGIEIPHRRVSLNDGGSSACGIDQCGISVGKLTDFAGVENQIAQLAHAIAVLRLKRRASENYPRKGVLVATARLIVHKPGQ